MPDPEMVANLITAAFAHVPYPGDEPIICHHCCECFSLRDSFCAQNSETISPTVIRKHYDSLPLFTAAAKQYFYPAYFRFCLQHPEHLVTQMVLYSLAADHRHDPPGGYTTEQVTAILACLDYLSQMLPTAYGDDLQTARTPWAMRLETTAAP